jgi:hypothetical protein
MGAFMVEREKRESDSKEVWSIWYLQLEPKCRSFGPT